METFVTRSLTKIKKATGSGNKLKDLRAECDAALERLKAARESGDSAESAASYAAAW